MPKVSIILTSYNHEKYLRESIDSVLAQTFADFELIIWDDASKDDSWKIINNYSDDRIKAFRNDENRRGIYGINKAIKEVVSGEYIAIHHSDDVWESTKLERQVQYLDINPDIGAVFTNALVIDEEGILLDDKLNFYYNIFDKPNRNRYEWLNYFFYHANALCHPSVLIRKCCYIDCGSYNCGLGQLPDFDMWIRLCLKYEIHILSDKLLRFRILGGEANTSGNRPDSRIRFFTEFFLLLNNYLKLDSFDEFVAVFPEAKRYFKENGFVPGFVLAMLSLEPNTSHIIKAFGVMLLFNLFRNVETSEKIKAIYNFDYRGFIKISGEHDIFSQESVTNLSGIVEDRNGKIANLNQAIVERDGQIANLNQAIVERDGQIASLNQAVAERDGQIASLKQDIAGLYAQISNLDQHVNSVTAQLSGITQSKSWMLTQPFRDIRRNIVTKPNSFFRKKLYYYFDLTYRRFPLSIHRKQKLKNALFQKLPLFFSWTHNYQVWEKQNLKSPIARKQSISSKVFDSEYYLVTNPEIARAGIDPLQHYCTQGWREGRNPHPLFNVAYYLQRNPDVKKAGVNPLEHYLITGWREGRDPHPAFDTAYYRKAGWYSTPFGISPLEYYLRHRCAATGTKLAGFDALLPRLQDHLSASSSAQNNSTTHEITPLISILMPTYNTPTKHLEASITSVLAQSYENWELCVSDDGSNSPETRQVLERFSLLDSRIQVNILEKNTGISAATNQALYRARGDFVAMLDHDDTLAPNALSEFVNELNSYPDTDAIYSDQDLISAGGERVDAYYKPDWSPELMRGVMYIGHLLMVRRSLAIDIGGFDSKFDRVQDFEFMLRVSERTELIRHIPKILYSWRMIPGSIAHNGDSKGKVEPLQCAAVNAHLDRQGLAGQATKHPVHAHRALIIPQNGAAPATITVIIGQSTTHEHLNRCLDSLSRKGLEVEVLLFSNDVAQLSRPGLHVQPLSPGSASGNRDFAGTQLLNMALKEVKDDYVMFMERPMELSIDWAERLVLYAGRPKAVLVSPLVINAIGTVAEAGLILHPINGIEPAMAGLSPESDGMAGSLSCAREVTAMSATCVCFRRFMVQKIGGFDPLYRIPTFMFADVALKAISNGLCNLYVPTVTAKHFTAPPQDRPEEEFLDRGLFLDRWSVIVKGGDRHHNPNYCPDNGGYAPY